MQGNLFNKHNGRVSYREGGGGGGILLKCSIPLTAFTTKSGREAKSYAAQGVWLSTRMCITHLSHPNQKNLYKTLNGT